MKKQILLGGAGIVLVMLLFIFGRTTQPKVPVLAARDSTSINDFDIRKQIADSRQRLSPPQQSFLAQHENQLNTTDLVRRAAAYDTLAHFWKDSSNMYETYLYYIAEGSKLENSEKKLTFAARLFLQYIRSQHDAAKLKWGTAEAIQLFEKAIQKNPSNDDLRIGLGSSYIYGKGQTGNPQETMKGIQELLAVARRDSNNMRAQIVLGVGGMLSGQYDKALERFKKVVAKEPGNVEAIAYMADAYAAKGEKSEAIKWYTISKRLVNDDHYSQEVDQRIRTLK